MDLPANHFLFSFVTELIRLLQTPSSGFQSSILPRSEASTRHVLRWRVAGLVPIVREYR
jgi:hypothetical protein